MDTEAVDVIPLGCGPVARLIITVPVTAAPDRDPLNESVFLEKTGVGTTVSPVNCGEADVPEIGPPKSSVRPTACGAHSDPLAAGEASVFFTEPVPVTELPLSTSCRSTVPETAKVIVHVPPFAVKFSTSWPE
jgi:hypothetical protein